MKIERPIKETYDFDQMIKSLQGETAGAPVALMELAVDPEIMVETTGFDFPIDYQKLYNIAIGSNEIS